ncbi:hypothetical protein [Crucian carp herpesvirus]|uniref:ORF145 n=1 Tax=Cyprinid herpesvirus 2 TaxID=317878 RepID=A0A0E3XA27_CYHV2|nr:hypothetical protein [Cyprinid herpesvirus 2]AMB21710.1 ORF145 [Cyprinid herpesvirus 2]APD51591.1 hypothetical protein [Crucian carp herpesvirus]QAU54863.1 protein ORF145 [Cyprinid herpesvirus 2]QIM55316.1 hypothetical protein [Cyprinid herpesvirus 2]
MKRQRTIKLRHYPGQDDDEEDYSVPIKRLLTTTTTTAPSITKRRSSVCTSTDSSPSPSSDDDIITLEKIRRDLEPLPRLLSPVKTRGPFQTQLMRMRSMLLEEQSHVQVCVKRWQTQSKNFMPSSMRSNWNKPGPLGSKLVTLLDAVIANEHYSKCFLLLLIINAPVRVARSLKEWYQLRQASPQQPQPSVPSPQRRQSSSQQPKPAPVHHQEPKPTATKRTPGTFGEINPEIVQKLFKDSKKRKPSVSASSSSSAPTQTTTTPPTPPPPTVNLDDAVDAVIAGVRRDRRCSLIDAIKTWFKQEARSNKSQTVNACRIPELLKTLGVYNTHTKRAIRVKLTKFNLEFNDVDLGALTMNQTVNICISVLQPHVMLNGEAFVAPQRSEEDSDEDSDDEDLDYTPFGSSDCEEDDDEACGRMSYLYPSEDEDSGKESEFDEEAAATTETESFKKETKAELVTERTRVLCSLKRLYTAVDKGLDLSTVAPEERPARKSKTDARKRIKLIDAEKAFVDDEQLTRMFTALRGKATKDYKVPSSITSTAIQTWINAAHDGTKSILDRACKIASTFRRHGGMVDLRASDWMASLIGHTERDLSPSTLKVFLRPNKTDTANLQHIFQQLPGSKELRMLWFNEASDELQSYMVQTGLRKEILSLFHPNRCEHTAAAATVEPTAHASSLVETYVNKTRIRQLNVDECGAGVHTLEQKSFDTNRSSDSINILCDAPQYTSAYFVTFAQRLLRNAIETWNLEPNGPLTSAHFSLEL